MRENIISIKENIDQEIVLYRELESLYREKQQILTENRIGSLVEIDSRIIEAFDTVKSLIITRNKLFSSFSKSAFTMTEVIERAREVDSDLASELMKQKETANLLIKELSLLDSINLELTKFGMKLTNKTMQIILDNVAIPTNEYNYKGKVVGQEKLELSSVSEEI